MQRTSIRIRREDLARIRRLASAMGVSQEQCISELLKCNEPDPEAGTPVVLHGLKAYDQIYEELQKNRRLLYRLIRTVCPLTEKDVNDPEFGIGLVDIYEDKNKHPEKYR